MSRILQPVLSTLARIYRFEGARQAPEDFDVAAPVQPVHDVAPEAERAYARLTIPPGVTGGTKRDGTWGYAFEHTFAGANTWLSGFQLSPGNLATYGLDLSVVDLYLVGCFAADQAATLSAADFWIDKSGGGMPGNLGTVTQPFFLVEHMTAFLTLVGIAVATIGIPTMGPYTNDTFKVGLNDTIYVQLTSTGADTHAAGFMFEIRPK